MVKETALTPGTGGQPIRVSIPSRGSGKGDARIDDSCGALYLTEFQSPLGEVVKETVDSGRAKIPPLL